MKAMMKRILSAVLVIAMLMSLSVAGFAASPAKVSVTGDGEATAGAEETFSVELANNPGVAGIVLVHTITQKSTGKDVTAKFAFGGSKGNWLTAGDLIRDEGDVIGNFSRNGANINWNYESNIEGDGVLCTMKLIPDANLINGTYEIVLALKEGLAKNFCDENTQPVAVEFVSYEFEVVGGVDLSDYEISVKSQPVNGTYTYKTDAANALTAEFEVGTVGTLTTQWYKCDADGTNGVKVGTAGSDKAASYVPTLPAVGTTEYYYCEAVNAYDAEYQFTARTNVAAVTYNPGNPTLELLNITIPSSGEYTGNAYIATVAAKGSVEGLGAITVKYNGSTTAPTAVGTYTVTVDIAKGANYNAVTDLEVGSFTISKAKVEVPSVSKTAYEYTGSEIVVSVPASDLYTVTGNTGTAVGSYTITVALKDTANYEWKTSFDGKIAWEITPATITYTGETSMTVYNNGNEFTPPAAAETKGGQAYTVTYVEKDDPDNLITVANGKVKGNAEEKTGTATIEATIQAEYHKDLVVVITVTVQNKITAEVTFAASTESKVYTGSDITLGSFFTAAAATDATGGTMTYVFNGTTYNTFADLQAATVKNAGTYTVKAVYESDTHYGEKSVTVTVERASVDKPTAVTGLVYNGKEQTGVAAGTGYTVENGKATDAGSYTAVAKLDSNHKWADGTADDCAVEWSIAKAKIDISGYTWNYAAPFTYNAGEHSVKLNSVDSKLDIAYTDNAKTEAGSYTASAIATVKAEYAKNYETVGTIANCAWVIEPKTVDVSGVTFTQTDVVYDGKEHTVAVSNLPGEGVTVTYTGDVTKTNVGTYTAVATLAAVNGNYKLSGTTTLNLTWNITKADLSDIVIDKTYKYSVTGEQVLDINLPADAGNVTYGAAVAADTKGIVTAIAAADGKVTITLSGAAAAGDTAEYKIPVTLGNYKDMNVIVKITLTDREAPVVTVDPITVVYSGNPITLANVTGTANVPGQWEFVTDVSGMVNAGEYSITVKFVPVNTVDYSEVTVSGVKLVIQKATPTVAVKFDRVAAGKTLQDANLIVESSSVPGTVSWKLPVTTEVEMNVEYEWIFTPTDTANYNTVEGKEILCRPSGGPGGAIAPVPGGGTDHWENPYNDVSANSWYNEAVQFVSQRGLMNGTGNDGFTPYGTVTRGTVMTILARRAGVDTTGGDTWYQKGVMWAVAEGISDGSNPNENISREQIVTMLWRAVKSPNYNHISLKGFVDGDTVSDWAEEAVKWAVGVGLLQGKDGNRLDPTGTATRAELASILMRFVINYG